MHQKPNTRETSWNTVLRTYRNPYQKKYRLEQTHPFLEHLYRISFTPDVTLLFWKHAKPFICSTCKWIQMPYRGHDVPNVKQCSKHTVITSQKMFVVLVYMCSKSCGPTHGVNKSVPYIHPYLKIKHVRNITTILSYMLLFTFITSTAVWTQLACHCWPAYQWLSRRVYPWNQLYSSYIWEKWETIRFGAHSMVITRPFEFSKKPGDMPCLFLWPCFG